MEWAFGIIIGLVVGGIAGAAMAMVRSVSKQTALREQLANANTRAEALQAQAQQALIELKTSREREVVANEKREAAEKQAAVAAQQLQTQQRNFEDQQAMLQQHFTEQLAERQTKFEEQRKLLEEAEKKLTDAFQSAGSRALKSNNEQFLELAKQFFEKVMKEASGDVEKKQQAIDHLVKPIKELLEKQNTALTEMEKKREADKSGLQKHLELIVASHDKLGVETSRLVNALRKPQVRGRWGEQQLRNVVELAGMTHHCDFLEQESLSTEDGKFRPDVIVKLPGEGVIVIDSKVSLEAYFDAIECEDQETRAECLKRHARQVIDHVASLANKRYWDAATKFGKRTPKLVVMFVSPESALISALEVNPELQNDAMTQHVVLATPTLLFALLRAVAYGWQQEDVAANAREISSVGSELYERLAKFVDSFEKIGSGINATANAYNKAIGTLESRVLPSTRKLKDMHATTEGEVETPAPVEIEVRTVVAAELKNALPEGVAN